MGDKACQQNVNAPGKNAQWCENNKCTDEEAKPALIAAVSLLDADAASDERRAMRLVSEDAKALNIPPEMLPKKAGDASGGGADAPGGAVFPDVPEAVGEEQLDLSLPDVMARFQMRKLSIKINHMQANDSSRDCGNVMTECGKCICE